LSYKLEKRTIDDILDIGPFVDKNEVMAFKEKELRGEKTLTPELKANLTAYKLNGILGRARQLLFYSDYAVMPVCTYGTFERSSSSDADIKFVLLKKPDNFDNIKKELSDFAVELNDLGGHKIWLWFATLDEYENPELFTSANIKLADCPEDILTKTFEESRSDEWIGLGNQYLLKQEAGTYVILHDDIGLADKLEKIRRDVDIPFSESLGLLLIAYRNLAESVLEYPIYEPDDDPQTKLKKEERSKWRSNSSLSKAVLRAIAANYIAAEGQQEIATYGQINSITVKVAPMKFKKQINRIFLRKKEPGNDVYICERNDRGRIDAVCEIMELTAANVKNYMLVKDFGIDYNYKLKLEKYFEDTNKIILKKLQNPALEELLTSNSSEGKSRRRLLLPYFNEFIDYLAKEIVTSEDKQAVIDKYKNLNKILEVLKHEEGASTNQLFLAKLEYCQLKLTKDDKHRREFENHLRTLKHMHYVPSDDFSLRGNFFSDESEYFLLEAIKRLEHNRHWNRQLIEKDSPALKKTFNKLAESARKDVSKNLHSSLESDPFNTCTLSLLKEAEPSYKESYERILKMIDLVSRSHIESTIEVSKLLKGADEDVKTTYFSYMINYFKKNIERDIEFYQQNIEKNKERISEITGDYSEFPRLEQIDEDHEELLETTNKVYARIIDFCKAKLNTLTSLRSPTYFPHQIADYQQYLSFKRLAEKEAIRELSEVEETILSEKIKALNV